MGYSRKLGPPIVSAAIATIVLTNFATVTIAGSEPVRGLKIFQAVWPIALTSGVAIILVMSFLYRSLLDVVSALEAREKAAQHQAVHDQLTGLANRALLEDRLGQALSRLRRDQANVALLMLDLDRFKQVNDTLGHAAGDILVQQVGQRLTELLRETDTVARVGGDEFAIIQAGPKSDADVRRLCDRIIEAISEPFWLGSREARVGVSVGAALATRDTVDAAELLRKADITMYQAKVSGRNCYRLFSDEMDEAVQRRDRLETALREALDEEERFELSFQPQIAASGSVTGLEGSLLCSDPVLGEIGSTELVAVAEECGLIHPLGELSFRRACQAARRWPDLSIAIDVSAHQFRLGDLPARLLRIAEAEGADCRQIELEITESAFTEMSKQCEEAIEHLRASGFRIALDDFGTGYSSLSHLRRFDVDSIKLDPSFVTERASTKNIAIVRAAVSLGHAMHIRVIAQGIETAEQQQLALEAGCDLLQGPFFSPALRADQLDALLAARSFGLASAA